MSHNNISIFIPHIGCPNKCSFCNQNSITGETQTPTPYEVNKICKNAFNQIEDKQNTEIAFFGGSFTAIDRYYMQELLQCVQEFIGNNKFSGIRISTRPDCINQEILDLLKKYNVKSIELGAQSTNDNVLFHNDRGHSFEDIANASNLIKTNGFELGLQMMVGLYKSTPEIDIKTANDIIDLSPNTVRIYPVVILENTRLGELFKTGEYIPYSIETATKICSQMIEMFIAKNIKIIKLGLHSSELVEEQMLGGLYHPAFRELCDNEIFYRKITSAITDIISNKITIFVAPNAISKAIGQKKSNIKKLEGQGFKVSIKPSKELSDYQIRIIEEEEHCT